MTSFQRLIFQLSFSNNNIECGGEKCYISKSVGLLILGQKKFGIVKRIRKQIDKFALTNEDFGIEIDRY